MNYTYLFDAAWLFLAGWIVVVVVVSVLAFGKDLLRLRAGQETLSSKQR
jgi:hypothetical protein